MSTGDDGAPPAQRRRPRPGGGNDDAVPRRRITAADIEAADLSGLDEFGDPVGAARPVDPTAKARDDLERALAEKFAGNWLGLREAERMLVAEFTARYGFTPRKYLGDVHSPGRYMARIQNALDTNTGHLLRPYGSGPGGLKVD